MKKYKEAEELYKKALNIYKKVLGENHLNTIHVNDNLRKLQEWKNVSKKEV